MRVLYIGRNVLDIKSGADSVNKRNISLLKSIFSSEFFIYEPLSHTNTLMEKVFGYMGGVSKDDEFNILERIAQESIELIFISQSLLGRLCKVIKEKFKDIKIVTFYHNIERHYARELIRVGGCKHFPFFLSVLFNESIAIKYSDYSLVLNERDSQVLFDYYEVNADLILPVSYKDIFDVDCIVNSSFNPPQYLFVGTAFFANTQAVQWFIDNVLSFVSGELLVVGKGMDGFKGNWEKNKKVRVLGFVDNLSDLYYSSTLVIAPIFSGGGMKTKVAEALMYGKTIVGTKEAFEGYKKTPNSLIECNSSKDFISALKELDNVSNFNSCSRELYSSLYSDSIIIENAKLFFKSIKVKGE